MTVMVSYIEGFSKLFLDVCMVREVEGGIQISSGTETEIIPSDFIVDFRVAIN